jgi:hypothetical protein
MNARTYIRACMSKQLTVRGVSEELAGRLEELARQEGKSVNTAVLDILESALGSNARRDRFRRYMTMSREEADELDARIREQRSVDEEVWR